VTSHNVAVVRFFSCSIAQTSTGLFLTRNDDQVVAEHRTANRTAESLKTLETASRKPKCAF
jgi:hypothetical protein